MHEHKTTTRQYKVRHPRKYSEGRATTPNPEEPLSNNHAGLKIQPTKYNQPFNITGKVTLREVGGVRSWVYFDPTALVHTDGSGDFVERGHVKNYSEAVGAHSSDMCLPSLDSTTSTVMGAPSRFICAPVGMTIIRQHHGRALRLSSSTPTDIIASHYRPRRTLHICNAL